MEQFDREKAKRVWQRVQAGNPIPPPQPMGVEMLAAGAFLESNVYRMLSRYMGEKDRQIMMKMATQMQQQGEILRGICRMTTGTAIPKLPIRDPSAPMAQRLRICYGRAVQRMAEYEKRQADPQFGSTFRKLAEQELSHCQSLLALIGKYDRPK